MARPEAPPSLARRVGKAKLLAAVLGAPVAPVEVGGFVVEALVGEGGMGSVYRARAPDGRLVALKLLRGVEPEDTRRFLREAALLRRVSHPRVVRHVDQGRTGDGRAWLAMEWLEGEDLAKRLRRGPLGVEEALGLVAAAAEGLAAIHAAGVLHRDLKPANLFLVGGSTTDPRVLDLGVARAADPGQTRLTSTGVVLGTPTYMAPEQVAGRADVRTDVYGLGAVLFESLTGAPPYQGDSPAAVLQQVLGAPVPSATAARPELPPAVDVLLGRLLAKDPALRPVDMAALGLELAALRHGGGGEVVLSRGERDSGENLRSAADTWRGELPAEAPLAAPTPLRVSREAASTAPPATLVPAQTGEALLGRARERGLLWGLLAAAEEEQRAAFVVLTGPSGVGRSALLAAGAAMRGRCLVRAEPEESGVPFALLRRLLGAPAWLVPGEGEARAQADRLRLAWLDQLDAWRAAPPALFVDDAHLADLGSLRFLALALEVLRDTSFRLVLTAPAGAPPPLSGATLLPVGPLAARPARELAERWFPGRGEELLPLAGGRPGELWRLGHAGATPGWSRLGELVPELRRVARAAALAGPRPEPAALGHLLGRRVTAEEIGALVAAGVLARPEGPGGDGAPLRFAGPAAREAVLATCTPEDRRRGAHAMAAWLEGRGRPAERAAQLEAAGEGGAAARAWLEAARAAMVADDPTLAETCLAAAPLAGQQRGELVGERAMVRAELAFWRGRVGEAAEAAAAALDHLSGVRWFAAASLAITAAGQRGDHAALGVVTERVLGTPGEGPEATDARLVALCRALSQLGAGEAAPPARLVGAALGVPGLGAEARAWQARARGVQSAVRSLDEAIAAQVEAHQQHLRAGDPRSAALVQVFLVSLHVWSGGWERAEAAAEGALRAASRLGADYLVLWARYARAKLWTEIAASDVAWAELEAIAEEARPSPRIRAGALVYAALAALRGGEPRRALGYAVEAARHPSVARAGGAAAVLARVRAGEVPLAEEGGAGEAEARAAEDDGRARVIEWDELVHLAGVEGARARGEDWRPLARRAAARIHARAATLADPVRRNEYLGRPHLVLATLALVEEGEG